MAIMVLSRAMTKVERVRPKVNRYSGMPLMYLDSSSSPGMSGSEVLVLAVVVLVISSGFSGMVAFVSWFIEAGLVAFGVNEDSWDGVIEELAGSSDFSDSM